MSDPISKAALQEPTMKRGKRLSRGQRIHRRRTLALQRRQQKAEAVTARD